MGQGGKSQGLFFNLKPVRALIALGSAEKEWYALALAKEVDCTFPHMVKIMQNFKRLGIVTMQRKGRKKVIGLTATGKQLAASFTRLAAVLQKIG